MTTKYVSDMTDIFNVVSAEFGIPAEIITSPQMRTKPVTEARHVAMYLAMKMTWLSKREIAAHFNTADHSGLYYGFNKVSEMMIEEAPIKKRIDGLIKKLSA